MQQVAVRRPLLRPHDLPHAAVYSAHASAGRLQGAVARWAMVAPVRFCRTPDGIQIAYRTAGSGPPLVFPAWWFTQQEVLWEIPPVRDFFAQLATSFTVVTYDKPGCGLSDRDHPAYTLEAQIAALEAVIDHLKLQRLALFGFSMGGPSAIAYAAHHPERV